MRALSWAICILALITLALELTLTRVFDVILTPNLTYMVITCAMFGFGLAGICVVLRPIGANADLRQFLARLLAAFAIAAGAIVPLLNLLPFDYENIAQRPLLQFAAFAAMYFTICLPFFLSGLVFATVFSRYAAHIQRLYFWDLAGAGIGCVAFIPFLPLIGPAGLILSIAGLGLLGSALLSGKRGWATGCVAAAALFLALPWAVPTPELDFRHHVDKRGVKHAYDNGLVEFQRWDPVSKIEVIARPRDKVATDSGILPVDRKHIAYEGGNQSSYFYGFDGNFARLRGAIERRQPGIIKQNFWFRGVLASHYFKRDEGQRVLIFGSAGGQETKAALTYGAERVDAVELVGTVVELGQHQYASYIGNIFNDPRVHVYVAEGRSFLRSSRDRYDIIQIFSNHSRFSVSAGSVAMGPAYLQTAEAYREYFEHLEPDGVLQVNHHLYPRMITTAALAWKQMGRSNFQRHVLVFERPERADNSPVLLIKMSPWTAAEVHTLADFLGKDQLGDAAESVVENPVAPHASFLSPEFYSGALSDSLIARVPFQITAATDDRPFFNMLRKRIARLDADTTAFLSVSTASFLNKQLRQGVIPLDLIHLFVTGAVSLMFAVIFIFVPLRFSSVGGVNFPGKAASLAYFSCLGAGFIILELVFIQIFMKLIGYPLYTYSTVIFALLFAAAIGSAASGKLGISPRNRWRLPFIGVLVSGAVLMLAIDPVFSVFLAAPTLVRALVAAALIFPVGLFLGMPFPLGILVAERQPVGAVAWAWGMNGLFTVAGGLLGVILALAWGFRGTVAVALGLYVLAYALFARMRTHDLAGSSVQFDPLQPGALTTLQ